MHQICIIFASFAAVYANFTKVKPPPKREAVVNKCLSAAQLVAQADEPFDQCMMAQMVVIQ